MNDQPSTSKGIADIVFLVDATGSMQPCINALKQNILAFVEHLESKDSNGSRIVKNWRAKVVGYRDYTCDPAHGLPALVEAPFVGSVEALKGQLAMLEAKGGGDEPESLLDALYAVIHKDSTAQDALEDALLWRHTRNAHRFVVVFTDAPFHPMIAAEGDGNGGTIADVRNEIMNQRVKLYVFAPRMDCYEELTMVDKSEYEAIDCDSDASDARQQALAAFTTNTDNFKKMIEALGKSISRNSDPIEL